MDRAPINRPSQKQANGAQGAQNATSVSPRKKKKKRSPAAKFFRGFAFVFMTFVLIGMTTAAICGMAFAVYINKYISPEVDVNLANFKLKQTSFIYTVDPSTGREVELQKLHGGEDRVWADIGEIPEMLQLAFISIEDSRFYTHQGVDWKRTIGAGIDFIVPIGVVGGGSTITQQLIKNITGEDETSVARKIQEVMRALEFERNYEKDDILEMYLNTIYFGQSAYGVKQAAMTYFGKEMSELSLAECAAIAGIVKNPYKFDLFRFPEFNKERRELVLHEMLRWGNITENEYNAAMKEKVVAIRSQEDDEDAAEEYQSYYVDAVITKVIADIQVKLNYSELMAKQLVFSGGLKIVIPQNLELQAMMDEVFQDTENFPGDLGSDGTFPQAAMVLMDPATGNVLAMYGGRGEKIGNRIFNYATQGRRQPGSAIKPITVYAPAIEYGMITPISVIDDAPKSFEVSEDPWPKNENRIYSGRTTIFRGIGSSLNTIAVDVLEQVGYGRSFSFATMNMGLNLIPSETVTKKDGTTKVYSDISVSPLALGGLTRGVSVLEMTAAYSAFVNNGLYNDPVIYLKVLNNDGSVLLDNSDRRVNEQAMSPRTRDYMIDLMSYVTSSGTGTKARIEGVQVAGKTGTTSDDNDRWFAGLTPEYAAVVWFGYAQPQSLQKFKTNPSLELWHRVMEKVYAEKSDFKAEFERSSEYRTVEYCLDSGLIPTPACRADARGTRAASAKVIVGDEPKETCDLHVLVEIDAGTNCLANDFCPSGENDRLTVGALLLQRKYPKDGVAVTDQEWVLDYELSESDRAMGLYKPTTPCKYPPCDVHNIYNDGNLDEGNPEDNYIPWWEIPWQTEPPEGGETTVPEGSTEPQITEPTEPQYAEPPTIPNYDPPINFETTAPPTS